MFAAPGFYQNYHARYVTELLLSHLLSDIYSQSSCSATDSPEVAIRILHVPVGEIKSS